MKELQIKVTGLVKEKTEALSHKTQIEEQYNILTAQLRAKVRPKLTRINTAIENKVFKANIFDHHKFCPSKCIKNNHKATKTFLF